MLAQTLQTLEADGFVHRETLPVIPQRVDYSLTDLGQGLVQQLMPLVLWISEHAEDIVNGSDTARRVGQ